MSTERVVAIGLDGATFDVLCPLIQSGRLPNLRALCEGGAYGRLRSTVPPLTAPAWTSFMTGVNPGKHGIFQFFANRDGKGPRVASDSVVNSGAIRAPSFWKFLNAAGLRVGLVGVPMTYPPPVVDGFVVAGMPAPLTPEGLTYPPELQARLPGYRLDLPYFLGGREFQAAYTPSSRKLLNDLATLLRERARYAVQLMREETWDFFMVVFTETDRLGHYLWTSHPGSALANKELGDEVVRWYELLDAAVGQVVDEAGPGATVLMMSDHGMGDAAARRVYFNDWLRSLGYLQLDVKRKLNINAWLLRLGLSRDRLARVIQWLPKSLSRPLVRRAAQVEVPLDLGSTRAYFEPVYEFVGGIRIIVRPPDVVAGSPAYEELRDELIAQLLQLTDVDGVPVLDSVQRREDVYSGPYMAEAPDLVLVLRPRFVGNHRVGNQSIITDRVEPSTSAPVVGAHRMDGIFIARGPGLRNGGIELEGLRIEDLAPTILHLCGLQVPASMDGRVVEEAFLPETLAAHPVAITQQTMPFAPEDDRRFSPEEEREVKRQLEGLGYLT